jgi:hypothetical protein
MPPKQVRTANRRRKRVPSTGPGERMTAEQSVLLRQLARAAYELEAFSAQLTQSEAARRIAALKAKLTLLDEPPHVL